MTNRRRRNGMALVTTIAVVTLIALLSVATLSLSTRLDHGSSLAVRDARLATGASFALGEALVKWRSASLGALAPGASVDLAFASSRDLASLAATVTRLGPRLYWVVGQATAPDGSTRRENLILRLNVPPTDSVPAILGAGDITVSDQISFARDTGGGCAPSGPDLLIPTAAVFTSPSGGPPQPTVGHSDEATQAAALLSVGSSSLEALAASADLTLQPSTTATAPNGVTHALGDLELSGGSAEGILVVDGRLKVSGAVHFTGIVVAKKGIEITGSGASFTGALRVGQAEGQLPAVLAHASFSMRRSACALQTVMAKSLMPRPVAGRRWAEMF